MWVIGYIRISTLYNLQFGPLQIYNLAPCKRVPIFNFNAPDLAKSECCIASSHIHMSDMCVEC